VIFLLIVCIFEGFIQKHYAFVEPLFFSLPTNDFSFFIVIFKILNERAYPYDATTQKSFFTFILFYFYSFSA
jgi:hypothetical protein